MDRSFPKTRPRPSIHNMRPALRLSHVASCAALLFAWNTAIHVGASQAPGDALPTAKLVSPEPDAYATGVVVLRADADEASPIENVTFFVDGRQVCIVTQRPFECDWDAGTEVNPHQIRAVFDLAEGGRVARTSSHQGAHVR